MQLREGGYYRRRDGMVAGPLRRASNSNRRFTWRIGGAGNWYQDDGRFGDDEDDADLVEEIHVTPVLPFTLEAGKKYKTVKPDGTPGPVVTLAEQMCGQSRSVLRELPFVYQHFCINRHGEVLYCGELIATITAPYIEPSPPTIAERLEKLRDAMAAPPAPIQALGGIAVLNSIIADVRKLEGAKP